MKIINPNYELKENNIFEIRKKEYDTLKDDIFKIIKVVEDIGFQIDEFEIENNNRMYHHELFKTLKEKVTIKLSKGVYKIDLSINIPKIIDNNYIRINGRKKVPQFQLYDIPIIHRGKNLKLRTNVATILVECSNEGPFVQISLLGRKIPLSLLILAYHGVDKVVDIFNIDGNYCENKNLHFIYDKLLLDLNMYYSECNDTPQTSFIEEIDRLYSKSKSRNTGDDIMYAIDLIKQTDPISMKFFKTDNIIDEIINALKHPNQYNDQDYENKRIRLSEYMITSKISKSIFNFCILNRNVKKPKYNINSNLIISECNVSDIIRFDFAINPIEELTCLTRCSLIGPGGFIRENVPEHLRDINDSMYSKICPVDTPDRENCGILQSICPNAKFDKNNKFDKNENGEPISIPVSLIPFSEHNDQTRLQMASSQMRQAIYCENIEPPMTYSGCEWLYSDKTQFKKNGTVAHIDNTYIIVAYDDNTIEIFDISLRKIYVSNLDMYNIHVSEGDRVKKGDILAESKFMNNGKLQFGHNLLTAVMSYYGYNYEDGIVISDRLVKNNIFTSVHYTDLSFLLTPNKVLLSLPSYNKENVLINDVYNQKEYKPLPDLWEKVYLGRPYAIMKNITDNIDYYSIFNNETELKYKKPLHVNKNFGKELPLPEAKSKGV